MLEILKMEHDKQAWKKTLRANQIIAGKRQAIVCTMFSQ
jgi:hypothetical protein